MCGFVALLSPSVPVRRDLLNAMAERIRHRGPDSGGLWVRDKDRVAMAHRRLSILDLSESAAQPMISSVSSNVLAFNGEIYNYVELRAELERYGRRFSTESDTEVLLVALEEWGEAALPRLNGMFAFTYWDERAQRLLIARDRFGEKPLFIGRGDLGVKVFASEMKAILTHPLVKDSVNTEAISKFGCGGWYEDGSETFFESIERFPPAHAAWFGVDGRQLTRWRYWTPDYDDIREDLKPRDAVEEFMHLLQNSVRLRLRADVPIGSSLSGGLDSSVIVGILAQARDGEGFSQNTFSACFPSDPTISEEKEIDMVSKHAGTAAYKVIPDPISLANESLRLHWHQEEPFLSASIYLQWCVARLAKEQGTKVLLDGQGADELLAGYQFYFRQRQLDLLDNAQYQLAARETSKFNNRLRVASKGFEGVERRFNPLVAYSAEELTALNGKSRTIGVSSNPSYSVGVPSPRPGSRLRRTLSEALLYNSLPMLLRYADRNSMAFSRESRLPYLDYNLVDFCIRLPDKYNIRNGWQKWILRQSSAGLIPEEIRWRADKVGYAAPLDLWLRKELKVWAWDRLNDTRLMNVAGYDVPYIRRLWESHQNEVSNSSWEIWRWISLAEWFEIHDRGWWRADMANI